MSDQSKRCSTLRPWILAAVMVWIADPTAPGAGVPTSDAFSTDVRPVLDQYCAKCHGPLKTKGGVNFGPFTNAVSIYRDPALWRKAVTKLRENEMPPDGKPQPTAEQRTNLVHWIDARLKDLDDGRLPHDPGRVLIHRLSRTEYNCTVRDLFGVDSKPADKFPSEGGGGGGFDNNADTLFIPPILMERYLAAASEILDQASHDTIFFTRSGFLTTERAAARKIIEHFALLAFRQPVQSEEIERFVGLFDRARQSGKAYEPAVKTALAALLVSPNFLFRIEHDQDGAEPFRINDYELASRLSYFLWSSMPDQELFRLAASRRLHEPKVLDEQVRRLVRDPRSKIFTDNFAGQWLRARELKSSAQPDPEKFPEYTPALRDAMYREVIEFFDGIVRNDRSLLEILNANYTFVNEDLAKLYGLEGVKGDALQRVPLADENRGGVLGMSAMLTLTSYPLRTSPVLRGKWVLEQVLGTPPPPPPPLVKSLPPNDAPVNGLSLRERLEKHRENPDCAGCHQRMDPLGFALENFDAIGRWRTRIGDQPVDCRGVLPDGEEFEGPAELKKLLLQPKHKDDFVRNLTEKMLAYALGRGLEYYDTPTVKEISQTLARNDYRSSVLIAEIVKSYPFQFRRNEPIQTASN